MSGRLVFPGVALGLLVALTSAIVACYEIPRPACGFVCGPDGACPDGYRCAADGVCHAAGAADSLVCARPDAARPPDAPPDTPIDAAADAPDAATDAPDAAIDAMP